MRSLRVALVAGCVVGSLLGCSGSAGSPTRSAVQPAISSQQKEALADGAVNWDEYQVSFQAYQACLSRKGYELVNPTVKGELMDFGVPAAAVDSGADDECYQYNWAQVDQVWQIAHEDTSESAQIVANCLRSKGITPKAEYTANLELLRDHGIDLADCPVNG